MQLDAIQHIGAHITRDAVARARARLAAIDSIHTTAAISPEWAGKIRSIVQAGARGILRGLKRLTQLGQLLARALRLRPAGSLPPRPWPRLRAQWPSFTRPGDRPPPRGGDLDDSIHPNAPPAPAMGQRWPCGRNGCRTR